MFSLLQEGYTMTPPMFTKAEVQQAVSMGWITQAQCNQIIGVTNTSTPTSANPASTTPASANPTTN